MSGINNKNYSNDELTRKVDLGQAAWPRGFFDLGVDDINDSIICVGSKWLYYTAEVFAAGLTELSIYRAPTWSGGVDSTLASTRDTFPPPLESGFTTGATVTVDGTLMVLVKASRDGGLLNIPSALWLAPDTDYLFRVNSLAATNTVNFGGILYERSF